jgi:hypothetical protein
VFSFLILYSIGASRGQIHQILATAIALKMPKKTDYFPTFHYKRQISLRKLRSLRLTAIAPPVERIPRHYFGMHFNYADTRWPNVNNAIGAVRVWDADKNSDKTTGIAAQWVDINPQPGVYNWQGLDARVNAALTRNADYCQQHSNFARTIEEVADCIY